MKRALLACQVFYKELGEIAKGKDIEVEFLPQGLHDLPSQEKMGEEIQRGIDRLEEKGVFDYIILGYGFCGGGVEGISTKNAHLVLPLVHDCIPLISGENHLPDRERTYYLSRGWIDNGGDSYKEYMAITGKLEELKEKFMRYEKEEGAIVDWYDKGRYQKEGRIFSKEMAEYVSYECMKNYHSITLIDNGYLTPFHHQYAQDVQGFVDGILRTYGDHGVTLKKIQGHTSLLEELFSLNGGDLLIIEPGEVLSLDGYI